MAVKLVLPWLPTANSIWRSGRNGVYLSTKYRGAIKLSRLAWCEQGRPRVAGDVIVKVYIFPPDFRRRDVDNPIKPTFDILTKIGVWHDDSCVKKLISIMCRPIEGGGKIVVLIDQFSEPKKDIAKLLNFKTKERKGNK